MRRARDVEWLRPEALAERWRDEPVPLSSPPLSLPTPESPTQAPPAEHEDPRAWCRQLAQLSRVRFGDGAITRLVDELGRLTAQRFGDATADVVPGELDAQIEQLIAHVEDLVDAFELRSRR